MTERRITARTGGPAAGPEDVPTVCDSARGSAQALPTPMRELSEMLFELAGRLGSGAEADERPDLASPGVIAD